MKYIMIFIGLLLSACVTTRQYAHVLQTWNGQSEESLVAKWGVPTQIYTSPGGQRLVEYAVGGGTEIRGIAVNGAFSGSSNARWCKTTFYIEHEHVARSTWQGTACKAKSDSQLSAY